MSDLKAVVLSLDPQVVLQILDALERAASSGNPKDPAPEMMEVPLHPLCTLLKWARECRRAARQ